MSSLLRSTKFLRYFTGAARTMVLSSARSPESHQLCNTKNLCAATGWMREQSSRRPESLEPLLQRLDAEVRRYGRISKRDMDDVFQEIRLHSITSAQSLLVIRCCGELVPEELPARRTQLVQKIWSVLSERGVPMDISHYNALLRVYLENEHPFSPAELLDELERKGLEPNRVTYQRLMWRYCQAGDVEGATRVLERMRELALPVSEPVLNALVMGHAFHGDTDGARAVLDTMSGAGLQPTNRTYALLACGYARKGDTDGVKSVFQLAEQKDILMTDRDMLDIVESLAIGGYSENVDYFLETMQKGTGYNQDALNVILRLINRGFEETAKKVLKTMNRPSSFDGRDPQLYRGAFFVKQLLKINRPADVVITTCRQLQEEGLVPHALLIATDGALQQGLVYLAQQLFEQLKQDGLPVRQHYYWPLLAGRAKDDDEEGLLGVLRSMSRQELIPNGETLQDYVIPYLRKKYDPEVVVLKLQGANVPVVRAARNVMLELLDTGDLKQAARIAAQYRPRGQLAMLSRQLVNSLRRSKDVQSFVDVLHAVSSGPQAAQVEDDANQEDKVDDKKDVGYIIFGAVKTLKETEPIDKLFTLLLSRGIGIGNATAESIQEFLGEKMTADLSDKLSKLTSSELEMSPLQRSGQRSNVARTPLELESLLAQAKERGSNTAGLSRQLITAYINSNEEEKLTSLLSQLEGEDFVLTAPTMAQIIEFYSQSDNVERALHYKDLLLKKEPDFTLNRFKVIRLAFALVKADRFDEALTLLEQQKQTGEADTQNFLYNSVCWQLLNHLAEQKDETKVRRMLEVLLQHGHAEPTNSLLGALVKVHLLREDVPAAMAEFQRCCETYRCTPWKGELTRRLIASEDAVRLQKLTDLSTAVHGEVNSLYDLVLAFVECGRLRQARRILETPGLRSRSQRLHSACERYVQEGKTECLEGLLEATKELSHIDRTNMFYHLLVSYCKADHTDKALGLWTLLQEDGETPSEQFLLHLAKHLQQKNMEVPFVVPSADLQNTTKLPQDTPKENQSKLTDNLKKAINNGDVQKTIEIIGQSKRSSNVNKKLYTEAIELLIKSGRADDAIQVFKKAVENDTYPDPRVMKYLLKVLAEAGELEKITEIGSMLSDTKKREMTYDNKLTQAKFLKGSAEQHIDDILQSLETAKDRDEINAAVNRFPRSVALAGVLNQSEILKKCEKIVELAAQKGNTLPANLLWMELLLENRRAEAECLWERHLRGAERLVFRRLLQEAHVRDEPAIIETLIERLQENPKVSSAALGNAYSRLVGLHAARGRSAPARAALERALAAGVSLADLNRSLLARLRHLVEAEGGTFPYAAPRADERSNDAVSASH